MKSCLGILLGTLGGGPKDVGRGRVALELRFFCQLWEEWHAGSWGFFSHLHPVFCRLAEGPASESLSHMTTDSFSELLRNCSRKLVQENWVQGAPGERKEGKDLIRCSWPPASSSTPGLENPLNSYHHPRSSTNLSPLAPWEGGACFFIPTL